MNLQLDIHEQTVKFTHQGSMRELPFAQFAELLLNGAPANGSVGTWVSLGADRWAGTTSAGLLRVRQVRPPSMVDLPVYDYRSAGLDSRPADSWDWLVHQGIIVPGRRHQVLVKGIVPLRTWEVEYGTDGLIRETYVWHDTAPIHGTPEQWRLGNVNTDGAICWGETPPMWKQTTTIDDIDFVFLTSGAFNGDWQNAEFQWSQPEKWVIDGGRVLFGEVNDESGESDDE